MATTKYSGWIKASGGNHHRAYLTYTVTSGADSYTITMSSGVNIKSGWYSMAKLTNLLSWTGGSTSKTVNDTNWKGGNHQMTSKTLTVKRTHAAQTITISGKITTSKDSGSVSASITIPARASYIVKQYSNGSLWSTKTKWYTESLALGTPTRTGYTFGGWWTGNNGTGTNYNTTYTANAAATLYAKWTAVNTTQTFNANGGTFSGGGTTTSKTVAYDATLAFSSVAVPTRSGYVFTGWAKASKETGDYWTNASVKITSTAAQTWYACWAANYIPPAVDAENIMAYRVNSANSTESADEGLFGYVRAVFTKGQTVAYNGSYTYKDVNVSKIDALLNGASGKFVQKTLDNTNRIAAAATSSGVCVLENTYKVTLRFYDKHSGSEAVVSTVTTAISSAFFTMDVSEDFRCIGFGVTATDNISTTVHPSGLMKIAMDIGVIDDDLEAAVSALGWNDCIE